mgnify:CR=1 FL=1
MEKQQRTEISSLGEFGLIKHLTEHFDLKNPSSIKGVGDDAAILDYKDKQTRGAWHIHGCRHHHDAFGGGRVTLQCHSFPR